MNLQDKVKDFEDRSNELRQAINEAIIDLLKENNLTEIKLSQNPDEVPWVVWFDNCNTGYDSRVRKVSLDGKGIAVEVYDEDCCCSATMTSDSCDLACTNIDWLCRILDSMNYTLSLPVSTGCVVIAGQNIEWSYDEPGLSELPERENEFIEEMLKEGKTNGELYHNDDDVEFNGTWKVKQTNTQ